MVDTSLTLAEREARKRQLDMLRTYLTEGAVQARRGEFVQNYSVDQLIAELDRRGDAEL